MTSFQLKADMITCFATAPGNFALRNRQNGSPFIQFLCHELDNGLGQDIYKAKTFHLFAFNF